MSALKSVSEIDTAWRTVPNHEFQDIAYQEFTFKCFGSWYGLHLPHNLRTVVISLALFYDSMWAGGWGVVARNLYLPLHPHKLLPGG